MFFTYSISSAIILLAVRHVSTSIICDLVITSAHFWIYFDKIVPNNIASKGIIRATHAHEPLIYLNNLPILCPALWGKTNQINMFLDNTGEKQLLLFARRTFCRQLIHTQSPMSAIYFKRFYPSNKYEINKIRAYTLVCSLQL